MQNQAKRSTHLYLVGGEDHNQESCPAAGALPLDFVVK
jgi:hypothetical protein